jgi:hypothetical protein
MHTSVGSLSRQDLTQDRLTLLLDSLLLLLLLLQLLRI